MLVGLALGVALAGVVTLGGTAEQADAAFAEKIVLSSDRTAGTGVNNPTGDLEIFKMNPDGTGLKQLTFNMVSDYGPVLSPDGTRVSYVSNGVQNSNPEGDAEVYAMNALDGKGKMNLTNNGADVFDFNPDFSPGGNRIAYQSHGKQDSNPEGDQEIYRLNALDGTGQTNLSDNGIQVGGVYPIADLNPDFSPDGKSIAYTSEGKQPSNEEGDSEIYRLNALDGKGKKNLSNNGEGVHDSFPDFSPDGTRVAYETSGIQPSNEEGDGEIYRMSAFDGTDQRNLSNSGKDVNDYFPVFSPGGKRIAYMSRGIQPSNLDADPEVYRLNALDGTSQMNLTNNGTGVYDRYPFFSSDGTRVFYESEGVQPSNLQGDNEVYHMSTSDGKGKKNLTNNDAFDSVYPD